MQYKKSPSAVGKACAAGLAGIGIMIALYAVSFLVPQSAAVHVSDPVGFITVVCASLALSCLWLVAYRFMDAVKPEAVSMVVYTFVTAAFVETGFSRIVTELLGSHVNGLTGAAGFVCGMLLDVCVPVCVLYAVFCLYVFRLRTFDEAVDGLIYGGFTGTGMAFAVCLSGFLELENVSVRYLMISMITKTTVYASIGALSGCVLSWAAGSGRRRYHLYALLLSLLFFSADFLIERLLSRSVAFASKDVFRVSAALVFTVVVFAAALVFIAAVLRKTESGETADGVPFRSAAGFYASGLVFFAAVLVCIAALRFYSLRTSPYEAAGYSFRLPAGFTGTERITGDSIFADTKKSSQNSQEFTKPYPGKLASTDVFLSFTGNARSFGDASVASFSPQNGWTVRGRRSLSLRKDVNGEKQVMRQYMYCLEKDGTAVFADVFMPADDDAEADRIIRIFAKTLNKDGVR